VGPAPVVLVDARVLYSSTWPGNVSEIHKVYMCARVMATAERVCVYRKCHWYM
jgi:transcriptional regulator with GAF, ATPase, and Fis domain